MSKGKVFVIAVDEKLKSQPENLHCAMDKAKYFAEAYDADLKLVFCGVDPAANGSLEPNARGARQLKSDYMMLNKQWLDEFALPYIEQGLSISTQVLWSEPFYEGVIKEAINIEASLLIKPVRKIDKFSEAIFANADWQLMRHCPIPLLLVKSRPWTHPTKVLAAIDPAHDHDKPANLDHRILKYTIDLAEHFDVEPHVVHTVSKAIISFSNSDKIMFHRKQIIKKMLRPYASTQIHTHLIKGRAERSLPEFTRQEGIDLVIMGAVSRSSINRAFVGHTAERILEELSCDTMVVKMPSFRSQIKT